MRFLLFDVKRVSSPGSPAAWGEGNASPPRARQGAEVGRVHDAMPSPGSWRRHVMAVCCCLVLGGWAMSAWAASGVMLRDEVLRGAASATAPQVGNVARGAGVEVLARQGGWTQVRVGGRTGWVRVLSVRADAPASTAALGGLVEAGTTRRDPSQVVAVAGLRGLTEEQLKTARFDAAELARLHQYAATRADAEQFARAAALQRRELGYLARPAGEGDRRDASPWQSP